MKYQSDWSSSSAYLPRRRADYQLRSHYYPDPLPHRHPPPRPCSAEHRCRRSGTTMRGWSSFWTKPDLRRIHHAFLRSCFPAHPRLYSLAWRWLESFSLSDLESTDGNDRAQRADAYDSGLPATWSVGRWILGQTSFLIGGNSRRWWLHLLHSTTASSWRRRSRRLWSGRHRNQSNFCSLSRRLSPRQISSKPSRLSAGLLFKYWVRKV